MSDTTFTPQEFFQQVGEFRKLMGDPTFMEASEEKRDKAIYALQFCYLHLALDTPQEEVESCQCMLQATMDEYARRMSYVLTKGLR